MKKLKAGALTYALFVGVVTAVLCFLMIMLVHFNRQYFHRMDNQERVLDNCLSGIALGLNGEQSGYNWIDLFGEGTDSVRVKTQFWGLYKTVSVEAKVGIFRETKSAMFGSYSDKSSKLALVVPERNSPIKLAGNALIQGNAELPKKGLATAYIEGKNYSRDKRIYGQTTPSKQIFPKLNKDLIETAKSRIEQSALEGDSLVVYGYLVKMKARTFDKATLVCTEIGTLTINTKLSGNMVLKATNEIIVEAQAQLEQVQLIAPIIKISAGFKGSLHLIASDSIVLEEKVVLNYPSSALILNKSKDNEGQFLIKKQAEFNGVAVYISNLYQDKNQAVIRVEEGALMRGQLYANKYIEHRGRLEGTIVASGLILITSSGVYQNHLLDGVINREKLVPNFAGLPIETWDSKPELITWL